MIRLVDLAQRHAEVAGDVEARTAEVLRSGRYVGGPVVAEAEATAATLFGRTRAVGVNSGTDALMMALQAVGVTPGDEVIVPALSFFATTGAVLAIGAVPVFCDVRDDGCIDPDDAARARTARTAAVVPVHLFGNRATVDTDLPVVDDAAQAVGADPPVSYGTLTAVSAYPTKTWGAAGDAGFVVGDDPALLARVRALGHHGHQDGAYSNVGAPARNSRLDALQAAVLLAHAPRLAERVARRRRHAARYDAGLPTWARRLPRDAGSPVQQYVIRVPERARVREALHAQHIETAVYYPRPMHSEPAVDRPAQTPRADALCAEVLALPVHAGLDPAQIDAVLAALHESRP